MPELLFVAGLIYPMDARYYREHRRGSTLGLHIRILPTRRLPIPGTDGSKQDY